MKTLIDSHVHLDLIAKHHHHRLKWLAENGCAVVSWAFFPSVGSVADLADRLKAKALGVRTAGNGGLTCFYLVGVHPRSIPPDLRPEHIASLLMPYLEDPLCRGIGEIGLETGSRLEREVFEAQLALGRTLDAGVHRIGIHTPRTHKAEMTAMTLEMLSGFPGLSPVVVIDHCAPATLGAVLDAGFWAGVTLSPFKTSWGELQTMVANFPEDMDRIMCNTDSGSEFFEDLVVCSRSGDLPKSLRKKLFCKNAARFFGCDALCGA